MILRETKTPIDLKVATAILGTTRQGGNTPVPIPSLENIVKQDLGRGPDGTIGKLPNANLRALVYAQIK